MFKKSGQIISAILFTITKRILYSSAWKCRLKMRAVTRTRNRKLSIKLPKPFQRLTKRKTLPNSRIIYGSAPSSYILMKRDLLISLTNLSGTGFHLRKRNCHLKMQSCMLKTRKRPRPVVLMTKHLTCFTGMNCRKGRLHAYCWPMALK